MESDTVFEDSDIFDIEQLIFKKKFAEADEAIFKIFMNFRRGFQFSKLTRTDKIDPAIAAIYTRLASCLCDLFLDYSAYKISMTQFFLWSFCARELRAIFSISGFYRTDFINNIFNDHFKQKVSQHSEHTNCLPDIEQLAFRLLLFSMLENETHADLSIFFNFFPEATLITLISLLTSPVVVTPSAFAKREALFDLIPLLAKHPLQKPASLLEISAVWMLCSYASRRDKHAVKFYLNHNIKSWLTLNHVMRDKPYKPYNADLKKPTVLVVLEFFSARHSMGRSYGAALKSLRDHFYLVGLPLQNASETNEDDYALFDKMLMLDCYEAGSMVINSQKLQTQMKKIAHLQPDIIFYPSLGMQQLAILLANMRLAPIQIMSFGHPASSFCEFIDYGIIEEDYAPETENLFSEKLVVLPPESFVSSPLEAIRQFNPCVKHSKEILRIGISSVILKVSANFLQVCKKIAEQSQRKIVFLFLLNETEMFYLQCKKDILHILPNAQVLYRLPPDVYLKHLDTCDLYLSTFPFGGANSVIDAMSVGLPVVCLRGEDIAGRTDSALISRRGLPTWLVAHSEEDYITAALRLIHNDDERLALTEMVLARSKELFLENNPNYQQQKNCFANAFRQIYKKHLSLKNSNKRIFSIEELAELP